MLYSVGYYSPSRYFTHSIYECAQGFVLHIPTLTVFLGPISMHDPTHIMLYWATCNYNNAYGCGDIEQNNIQTWRLS